MLSGKSAGMVLFVSFLMLSGMATAEEGDRLTGREVELRAANFA